MIDPTSSAPIDVYQEAFARHELLYVRCLNCRVAQLPLASVCRICGSNDLALDLSTQRGTLHSFTVIHRAPTAALREHTPYTLALVDMDEGYRLMVTLVASSVPRIGDVVSLAWGPGFDGKHRPHAVLDGGDVA
ncbi:MAG: hypothetical protein JWO15_1395 [Sphingomonadales bacterium]|nr:hypothetical protein [Sphingomonadales bacterium]